MQLKLAEYNFINPSVVGKKVKIGNAYLRSGFR